MSERIRIAADGSIKLPAELREKLGWTSGTYLEFAAREDRLEVWKVDVDLFAEAMKAPDQDGFDKVLRRQQESRTRAFEDFDKKIQDAEPLRPEERPQFWD